MGPNLLSIYTYSMRTCVEVTSAGEMKVPKTGGEGGGDSLLGGGIQEITSASVPASWQHRYIFPR